MRIPCGSDAARDCFFSPDALEITWRRRNLCVGTYEWLRRYVVKSTSGRNFWGIYKVLYQILFRFSVEFIRTR